MNQSCKVPRRAFIAHHQPAEVLQPREHLLDLPSAAIAPERTTILRGGSLPILSVLPTRAVLDHISTSMTDDHTYAIPDAMEEALDLVASYGVDYGKRKGGKD